MEDWQDFFTQRELQEIRFNRLYAASFNHGTDAHTMRIIIAKFFDLMEEAVKEIQTIRKEP